MTIELFYLEGCPHVRPTIERLSSALRTQNLKCSISKTKVRDSEAAVSARFLGSPTVRINGVDIEPAARQLTGFGMMCRTYDGGGVPSEALIRNAIAEALAASGH